MNLGSLRRNHLLSTGAVVLPALALGVLAWRHRWVTDDAYINFRIVDNLLAGSGPVFNAGERVEAYTSTAWLAALAVAHGLLRLPLEWTSVVLGLLLTLGGLVAASRAALMLMRALGRQAPCVPVGAAVLVAVQPMWDFATSGLDTGLGFGWLGASFLAVVALATRGSAVAEARAARLPGRSVAATAVLVGLGPLIRPDFALFSVGYVAALIVVADLRSPRSLFGVLAAAAALPVTYELFRMGYFAALVPNPAFAKEAGQANWARGVHYLANFGGSYELWWPVPVVLALVGGLVRDALRAGRWRLTVAMLAPSVAGLLHALYVVRVGGDFMHGRLLLPGLFALILPVMTFAPAGWRSLAGGAVAIVFTWAVVCLVDLRPRVDPSGAVVEERGFYVALSGNRHPVTREDYAQFSWAREGRLRRALVGRERVVKLVPRSQAFLADPPYPDPPSAASAGSGVVAVFMAVGVAGDAAGRRVRIVDRLGLADPLGARVHPRPQLLSTGGVRPARLRPGHEKVLPLEWVIARYADFSSPVGRRLARVPAVSAARRALGCGDVHRLVEAVDSPLTLRRFLANVRLAILLHGFRLDPEPQRAERDACGEGR